MATPAELKQHLLKLDTAAFAATLAYSRRLNAALHELQVADLASAGESHGVNGGSASDSRALSIVWCGVAGVAGSLVMFVGDALLYGPRGIGESGHTYLIAIDPQGPNLAQSVMGSGSQQHVMMGGLLGPVAATLYFVGCYQMVLAGGRWGLLACAGHAAMAAAAAAYHVAFAYTGFLASSFAATPGHAGFRAVLALHAQYMSRLRSLSIAGGAIGSAALAAACWQRDADTCYPRWLPLATPLVWLALLRHGGEQSALSWLPAPYGALVAGGSFNLCYALFFVLATASAARASRRGGQQAAGSRQQDAGKQKSA